jgi:hypothetical protein
MSLPDKYSAGAKCAGKVTDPLLLSTHCERSLRERDICVGYRWYLWSKSRRPCPPWRRYRVSQQIRHLYLQEWAAAHRQRCRLKVTYRNRSAHQRALVLPKLSTNYTHIQWSGDIAQMTSSDESSGCMHPIDTVIHRLFVTHWKWLDMSRYIH